MIGRQLLLDQPFAPPQPRGRLMARILGATFIAGPIIGVAALALERPVDANWFGVLGAAAVGLGLAAALLSGRIDRMSRRAFTVVMYVSIAALSAGVYFAGRPGSGVTLFYLWVVPLAFYFLPLAHALVQAFFAVACFGAVAVAQVVFNPSFGPAEFEAGRWLMLSATIVVTGLLVYSLSFSLRQSTRLVERGFEESLAGVAVIGLDGRCIAANEAMARMVGRPVTELVGTGMEDVSHPDDVSALAETLRAASGTATSSTPTRRRYVRPDGEVVWAERTYSLVRDERERPLFLFVQAMDVSDRVRAEESLARSERRLRAIFDNVPLGLTFSAPDGTLLEANHAAEVITGYPAAELLGKSSRQFIHASDLAAFDRQLAGLTDAEGHAVRVEARIVRRDQQLRDAILTIAGVFESQALIGRIAIADDVTERKRAESEAAEARRLVATILASAPVLVFALDAGGKLVRVEGNVLEKHGIDTTAGRGRLEAVLAPAALAVPASEDRGPSATRSTLIELDGVQLESVTVPVFDADGLANGAVGVAVDVTERRRAEVAERDSQAKSRFLANMSHELRNPVNIVLGFAQLLQRESPGPLNDRQRHYVKLIQEGGGQMLDLLNDLLDLSKVVAGKMEVEREPVDVGEVVATCVEEMTAFAESRRVSLSRSGVAHADALADRRRVAQVVLNLVSNAIKFTREGGSAEVATDADADSVRVRVTDTGIGIPAAELERIFDEFTQLGAERGRSQQGTGLGLPLSRRLAELMGGGIEVESTPGEGSVFTLTLPRVGSAAARGLPAGASVGPTG